MAPPTKPVRQTGAWTSAPAARPGLFNPAAVMAGVAGPAARIIEIPLDQISPDPDQVRRHFDPEGLTALAATIERNGLINPIQVRRTEDDRYLITAGERRYRACLQLGRKTIPCIIGSGDAAEIALIDNVQRVDLNFLELAEGFHRLMTSHGYSVEQVAGIVGRARPVVSTILALRRLAETIKADYPNHAADIALRTLYEISKQPEEQQLPLWEAARAGEGIVAIKGRLKDKDATPPAPPIPAARRADAIIKRTGKQLQDLSALRDTLTADHRRDLQTLRDAIDALLA